MWRIIICIVLLGGYIELLQAKIILPSFFTNNMVLQQKREVTFYGTSSKNNRITIKVGWSKKEYHTLSDYDGRWSIKISTPKAGGPYDIQFSDDSTFVLKNILIGEVWLCSGQSNMEMPLAGWGKVMNYEQEIKEANYSDIRLFQVQKATALSPKGDLESTMGGWQVCTSSSVENFSALAYFYARQLWKNLDIPIGVIDCTWGGTPAEAWTSYQGLCQVVGFEDVCRQLDSTGFDQNKMIDQYNMAHQAWKQRLWASDKGVFKEIPIWSSCSYNDMDWKVMNLPVQWEKDGLPGFDGVVWFRKKIDIPKDWENKDITLSLGMIDDEDIVYLNGEKLAAGSGFNNTRVYLIPGNKVKSGTSILTIRVFDSGGEGGIIGSSDMLFMSVEGQKVISLAGEWKYNIGVSLKEAGDQPLSPVGNSSYPTVLYNAMIHPLTSLPIQGIIWYQGEANVGHAVQYESLFQNLIQDWRTRFKSPEMPFYFVQLANYLKRQNVQPDSEWAALREAQSKALHLNATAMATIIDIGEAGDIHPKNKQEVGRRLALCALSDVYGKKVISSAPQYDTYTICGKRIYISFNNIGNGFDRTKTLKGFVIAGPDHCFHEAQAFFEGDKVVVECPEVQTPIAVRYGWADNPECTLLGSSGLPVAPFRTDNWY